MNPFKKLFGRNKTKIITTIADGRDGWHSMGGTLDYYKTNDYENGYPSIKAIANAFLMIEPYTIDRTGKKVASNILDRIYTPNNQMSAADFREALAVMTSVHSKVNIRVHYSGDNLRAETITGFTFIENCYEYVANGKRYFQLVSGKVITDDEVITLKGINPYDLSEGFSPSRAAHKWIKLDDYIAEYQNGFFKNGAVPAGQFIITARTISEFNDIVDNMQRKHRGADKNNNVIYTHRPTDSTGKPVDAQVEWIPFSTSNKDLSLKDLFEQANKKIDSAFGVPASIRGVNDSNTYASVREDERIFAQYVVKPITMKIWGKFTHELNRITGGAGVAIAFDIEIPQVADEELVKAEAKAVEANIVSVLATAGYTEESIGAAFDLVADMSKLVRTTPVAEEEDTVEIMTEEELDETPNQPDKDNPQLYSEKSHPKVKKLTDDLRSEYENRLERIAKAQLQKQVNGGEAEIAKAVDATEDEVETFAADLFAVIAGLMLIEGSRQRDRGVQLILNAGLDASNARQFSMTAAQTQAYREYLKRVATSYTETNAALIRSVLERSAEQGLTVNQTRQQLQTLVSNDHQAMRLARTEVSHAASQASVDAMENIKEQTGYEIVKVWNANGDACEYCMALDGTVVDVEEVFIPLGGSITGIDGGTLENNFSPISDTTAHPNCSCFPTYEVRS